MHGRATTRHHYDAELYTLCSRRVWLLASRYEARPGGSGNPDPVSTVIKALGGFCVAMECAYVGAHAYRDVGAYGHEGIVGWVVDALARNHYATPPGHTPRGLLEARAS